MEMIPQQGSFLTLEQRELRALANEAATLVKYMTRDRCEMGIQCLLPLVREAVVASHVVVPAAGLDEKKGMDLIEAIRQRRKRDHQVATSSLVEMEFPPPKSGGDENVHKSQKKKKKKKEKKPPKEKEEDDDDTTVVCAICHSINVEEPVIGCDAEGCDIGFHPVACAAYPRSPGLDNGLDAYCADCLTTLKLKPSDVLWQEEEVVLLNDWFALPNCPFQRVEVESDGRCALRAIWTWLQRNKHLAPGLHSFHDLGVAVSEAALKCIEQRTRQELPGKERKECNRVWQAIKKEPESLQKYWNTAALDYLWIALTTRVLPTIRVEIWQMSPRERYPLMLQRSPDAQEGNSELLRVLRSNPNIAPHYDLLMEK